VQYNLKKGHQINVGQTVNLNSKVEKDDIREIIENGKVEVVVFNNNETITSEKITRFLFRMNPDVRR